MTSPREQGSTHERIEELLAWHVNGTLEAAEARAVEAHLAGCVACRAEAAYLRELAALVQAPEALPLSPGRGLAALEGRLEGGVRRLPRTRRPWVGALLVAQAAGILLLLGILVARRESGPPVYRTLTSPPQAGLALPRGGFHVLFRDGTSEEEVRELLTELRLAIVDGPSPVGVYTVAPRAKVTDGAALLAALRDHPAVRFAAPVTATQPP